MEDRSESLPEEIQETEDNEGETSLELEEMTTQPEAVVERWGNIEEAEAVEVVFVDLINNAAETLESGSTGDQGKDEEEDRILVNIPAIDEEDDGIWAEVGSTTSDEGAFFVPDIENEGEYRVKVEFPWLMKGDEDREDFEANWVRVGAIAGDGNGAWFLPEVDDEVLSTSGQENPPPADIRLAEDTGGDEDMRVSGEEIKPAEDDEEKGDS